MSGADDQRTTEQHVYRQEVEDQTARAERAEAENYRLRAELAETRGRRDYLRGQLDRIYYTEYYRNDTLKRRIAELEDAGNTLADDVREMLTGPVPEPGEWWSRLAPRVDAWRSAPGGETRG